MSVAVMIGAYVLHQRNMPYITFSAISESLGLTRGNMDARLRELKQIAASASKKDVLVRSESVARKRRAHSSSKSSRTLLRQSSSVFSSTCGAHVADVLASLQSASASSTPTPLSSSPSQSSLSPSPSPSPSSPTMQDDSPQSDVSPSLLLVRQGSDTGSATPPATPDVARRHEGGVWRFFRLYRTALYTGVIDYNHLESAFLIAASMILMLGMVFTSNGFTPGSVGYLFLTSVTFLFIVGSTTVFATLLSFEVYRSFKFSKMNDMARQVGQRGSGAARTQWCFFSSINPFPSYCFPMKPFLVLLVPSRR